MKSTTDIWLAGFLVRNGHRVVKTDNSTKRAKFFFAIDGDQWQQLKLEWMESADMKIKYTHERLKDLIYQ